MQRSGRAVRETTFGISDMRARRQVFAHLGRNVGVFTVAQTAWALAIATFADRGGVGVACPRGHKQHRPAQQRTPILTSWQSFSGNDDSDVIGHLSVLPLEIAGNRKCECL